MTAPTDPMIWAEIQRNGARRARAWRTFIARQIALGAKAHPETGGNAGLIHNWGNDAARAVQARGQARWARLAAAFDARYSILIRAYGRSV